MCSVLLLHYLFIRLASTSHNLLTLRSLPSLASLPILQNTIFIFSVICVSSVLYTGVLTSISSLGLHVPSFPQTSTLFFLLHPLHRPSIPPDIFTRATRAVTAIIRAENNCRGNIKQIHQETPFQDVPLPPPARSWSVPSR